MAGTNGRTGAPMGNLNNLKNGSRLSRNRLTVGELPKEFLSVRREGRAYRRTLEAAVIEIKGLVSLTDAHHIDTASAATIQAGICRWLLRNKIHEMTTSDIRGTTQDIVKSKERRDAAVKALDLDVKPEIIDLKTYIADGNGRS